MLLAGGVPAIANIVEQVYRHYIARIGRPPRPMLDDYPARVSEGLVWVVEEGAVIAAMIVLVPGPNYLLLDNIAVSPARQGLGLGRRLLAFAEDEALRRGYCEIRLYTHQTMVENQLLYTSISYEERGRGAEAGYDRVFMRKQLRRCFQRRDLMAQADRLDDPQRIRLPGGGPALKRDAGRD